MYVTLHRNKRVRMGVISYYQPPVLGRNWDFTTYSSHLEWQNIQFVSQTACVISLYLQVFVTHLHLHTTPMLRSCFSRKM